MLILTDALRTLASARMRALLTRFTRSPVSGTIVGAFTTAVVQSSSATMVTVISFVGASLMTFPQSIGVVYGANIGTTITGWIVATLGLKLKLDAIALPVLLGASLLRLATTGRIAQLGLVLAGFCLVFIGLGMMQDGASAFQAWVTPGTFPADTWFGRLRLVVVGVAITLVIQSSSAGIAMVLVLFSVGSLSLAQGAALIVGMDVGTTGTALLATLGGSRDMRRTAIAHVAYNLVTGIVAFFLIVPATGALGRGFAANDPVALVTFHSLFNVFGAILMLPFTRPFARLITWLVPQNVTALTDTLDRRLLPDPLAALTAAQSAAEAISARIFGALATGLSSGGTETSGASVGPDVELALSELEGFLARVNIAPHDPAQARAYSALLHETDHLLRLARRAERHSAYRILHAERRLGHSASLFAGLLDRAATEGPASLAPRLSRAERLIGHRIDRGRRGLLLGEHAGLYSLNEVFTRTDILRWLARSLHHVAQIAAYAAEVRTALEERGPSSAEP